jgi:Flp pilus assembly pilin Flp
MTFGFKRRLNVLFVKRFVDAEKGQGLSEYALIMALVSIAAVAALTLFGHTITTTIYGAITDAINGI